MELRVLQYFLAVAREQSISGAAETLHLSQPTLSTQLKSMEEELGKQLLIRGSKGSRKVTLTEEGMLLRKRAEEILDLVKKTENEISSPDDIIAGDIYIGAGETDAVRYITKPAQRFQEEYPQIRFHITSGDACDISEQLDKGLLDFAILIGDSDKSKYDYHTLPAKDKWGVLMKKSAPLAKKAFISPEDLHDKPLIVSRQAICHEALPRWLKKDESELHVIATYNLIYNAALMVDEGMGYALTLDKLINTTGDCGLCFKPLQPPLEIPIYFAWKKYQVFTKAAEKFLKLICRELDLPNF